MRRFVLGWKKLGLEQSLGTRLVTYADDLVILCRRGSAETALHHLREIMGKLKLAVNEESGFAPPLGIALRADGFSAVMLVTAAIAISAAGFFARANFGTPQGMTEARAPLAFWMLLQALWAALNIVFLGGRF
jgi:formate hydrogenlyase subunit 3/multisubunit Na+/H+ antiporter MnhD subunit